MISFSKNCKHLKSKMKSLRYSTFVLLFLVLSVAVPLETDILQSDENFSVLDQEPNASESTFVISLRHEDLFLNFNGRGALFREIELQPQQRTRVSLENFEDYDSGFGVAHVHGYGTGDLRISFDGNISTIEEGPSAGKHLGFIVTKWDTKVWISSDYSGKVTVLFAFLFYDNDVPVPGGCNQELPNALTPILKIESDPFSRLIQIDIPAAAPNRSSLDRSKFCWTGNITYEMRYRFIERRNIRSFFRLLKKILLGRDRMKWQMATVPPTPGPVLRRLYKKSLHLDLVVLTIVSNQNHIGGFYIPAVITGTPTERSAEKLRALPICIILIIFGIFKLCFGSRHGKNFSGFFAGIEIGAFVVWLVNLIVCGSISPAEQHLTTFISFCAGITFGVLWSLCLPALHRNYILVSMAYKMIVAYIFACYTFYFIGDQDFIMLNPIYWQIFAVLVIFYCALLLTCIGHSNLVTSAFLGTLYVFISLTYLTQSSLRNAIYDSYARVAVPQWNFAYGNTDISLKDYFEIAFAIMVFGTALIWRLFQNETWAQNGVLPYEQQPLISRMADASQGSDSVFESPQTNFRFFRQLSNKRSQLLSP